MDVEVQLATYVCFKDDAFNNIVEHIRLCKPGWEVEHISDLLDWQCCSRVQSAQTASMTGWHCGLVSHIRQVTFDILSMHWIIHRGSVGFQTHEPRTGRCLVLMSLTSLNHRPANAGLFHKLCNETGSDHRHLLLHMDEVGSRRGESTAEIIPTESRCAIIYPRVSSSSGWLTDLVYLADGFWTSK